MIAPRRTLLVRADSLAAWQHAIAAVALHADLDVARDTAVLVPTRGAAAMLRRRLEAIALDHARRAIVLPDLVTRREWYERLGARAGAPRLLTAFEREAILQAAAHAAITDGAVPPFHLRPALVVQMRELYDALRGRRQAVDDFERLLIEQLEQSAAFDRGAERMLRQTRFLAAAFHGYEQRVLAAGGVDEHGLRAWLLEHAAGRPYRTVVVTVADRAGDPDGLWPADFDLLTRLAGLETIAVAATEHALAAGLFERLHDLLPGIEVTRGPSAAPAALEDRVLLVPESDEARHFTSRDREEELVDVARRVRALDTPLERVGVVFARPLPYLYLARGVLADAALPFQCQDALPLAAEPFAAAVDLLLALVAADASRETLIPALQSPHLSLQATPAEARDLGAALDAAGYRSGDRARLLALARGWSDGGRLPAELRTARHEGARRGAAAAVALLGRLDPLFDRRPASAQLGALRACLEATAPDADAADALHERLLRARAAILAVLDGLAEAHRRHDDLPWGIEELSAALHRWMEGHTFSPRSGDAGLYLVDAVSARYGAFDDLHLVGLVDGEWPERSRRNVFYAPALLRQLGWPSDADLASGARAGFLDLVAHAGRHVSVSTFSLEHDALVEPSALLEDLASAPIQPLAFSPPRRPFRRDALLARPVHLERLDDEPAAWAALRASRSPASLPAFHGQVAPVPVMRLSVSALEQYALCPFKHFARHRLRLEEERDEGEGLTPLERGRFLHEVFETFFAAWQASGRGAIGPADLPEARERFAAVAAPLLDRLPPADAALERVRLLGSAVAAGVADLVFRMEAERASPVVERLLEHEFEGRFHLAAAGRARDVGLRGIADRIDLMADGTFRIIDYKSSPPVRPIQLAVYAACAAERLRGHRGRDWELAEAVYLVFRGPRPVLPLGRGEKDRAEKLESALTRALDAVEGVEQGAFPPRPIETFLCATCAWSGVCRRDYVTAQDEGGPEGDADAAPAL